MDDSGSGGCSTDNPYTTQIYIGVDLAEKNNIS